MTQQTNSEHKVVVQDDRDSSSSQVFIGNLSFKTTKADLISFASSLGTIVKVKMVTRYGRSRGFGFITYATENEAKKAVEALNQTTLDGRNINVQIAHPKSKLPAKEPTDPPQEKRRHRKSKNSKSLDTKTKQSQKKKKPVPENGPSRIPSKTTLFVANLSYATTDNDLVKVFGDYRLVSAYVARARNGYSKGYGFVELESEQEQHKAYESLKDVVLDGRTIYLKIAMSAEHEQEEEEFKVSKDIESKKDIESEKDTQTKETKKDTK